MDVRTVVDVEGWESRPFGGGYDGLHDLADREFTGCVVAGDSYLYMTRGRVVGVFDYAEPSMGDPTLEEAPIDRFEGVSGTAHEAPHDALALLFAMGATGGETRGRYYSNNTPLEEVDRTLQDGGFTGYLELSENVLSGDYYLVYHGGRRRTVAFVGQSRRLKADEEAFDLAADEVGIYEVNAVRLSTVEIPGSGGTGGGAAVPDAGPSPADDDLAAGSDETGGRDEPLGNTGDREETAGIDLSSAIADVDSSPGPEPEPSESGTEPTTGDGTGTGSDGGTVDAGSSTDRGRPEIDLDAALNPGGTGEPAEDPGSSPEPTDASPTSPLGEAFAGDDSDDSDDSDHSEDTWEGSGSTAGPRESGPEPTDGSGGTESADPTGPGSTEGDSPEAPADASGPDAAGVEPSDAGDVDFGGGAGHGLADGTDPGEATPIADEADKVDEADEADEADESAAVESAVSAVPEDETVGPGEEPADPPSAGMGAPREATPEDVEAAAAAAEAELEAEAASEAGTDDTGSGTDPDGSAGPSTAGDPTGAGAASEATAEGVEAARVVPSIDPERTGRAEPTDGENGNGAAAGEVIDGETVAGLRSELSAREARIEELRDRLEAAEAAHEELEAERDRLEERMSELERRLEESGAAPIENTRELPPAEALSGTSILVRYRSKSEPTLADVHDGRAKRDALAGNLTLEPHPSFDTGDVTVAGRTFDAFIESTRAYGFLRWLVEGFPYEIRDTESTAALKPLWDALPALDRVEFDATVTLEGLDRETARFDLVGRDRQGNPLLVALLESDRAPTDAGTMSEFVRDATAAAESHESLVGAFAVTASYFEPEALQTAQEATGGSLLSRSKRKSFVKTSRKGGYHLCLVEDREESFYLSEPDL